MATTALTAPIHPVDWQEEIDPESVLGLGVAGNFAGHLEQAGEASDFVGVQAAVGAPKGVFPFYVPSGYVPGGYLPGGDARSHFLHVYPVSTRSLRLGSLEEKHQIEPEVALLFALEYVGEGSQRRVAALHPRFAMAHNDCSIRREGARKISEKKNWGAASKGTAARGIPVDRFSAGGILDTYRLASFLVRDDEVHEYGADSPLTGPDGYSYFYDRLHDWLVEKLGRQQDDGPLEDIARWIGLAGHPAHALISVGATRYTPYGETTFLAPGDRIVVALYDGAHHEVGAMRALARQTAPEVAEGCSLLVQEVEGP